MTSRRFPRFLCLLAALSVSLPVPVPCQVEPIDAPFAMGLPDLPRIPDRVFDIRQFGAVEGGTVKNTGAFREAMQAAAHAGGGIIEVPPGRWLTGAIHFEDHTALRVSRGAEVRFSQDPADYLPAVFSRHEDTECFKYSAFLHAEGKTDIAIIGEGTLHGQGTPWWAWKTSMRAAEALLVDMGSRDVPVKERVFDGKDGRALRPAFFQPMHCRNILVEGVTFLYGAFWTITPTYCENVTVRNVTITTEGDEGHVPNGDGVDPSSCRNVLIEHCTFNTGDDCVAIKAGRDHDGLRVDRPTENVVVRHCRGLNGHGGIVIGSETSGGIRNVYAYDCAFQGTDRIVRLKTARGRGGVMENMWFSGLRGENIQREALHLNMLYVGERLPAEPVSRMTPRIRNIHFRRITLTGGKSLGVEILGLPEMNVEDVTLDSLSLNAERGFACTDAQRVTISNAKIIPARGPAYTITECRCIAIEGAAVAGSPFLRVDGGGTAGVRVRYPVGILDSSSISRGTGVGANAVTLED